ncbi:MAG TPA: J domain-containing protein, partial [Planctomycetaceae bacterium]|nr:J domain-containing protein [Planctomycetaceae bacterium]
MTPPDPDWSLLPHDPEKFFGLDEFYDRRDLKRAYNQYLKRFKPEKHPEEFQRLRAAYEGLEQRLRYGAGMSPPAVAIPTGGWDLPVATPAADAPDRPGRPRPATAAPEPPQPREIPWHTRVQSESVETLAAELRERSGKS